MKQREIDIPIAKLKQVLDARLAIQNNQSLGGTSPTEVHRMIENFTRQLDAVTSNIATCQTKIEVAHQKTLRNVEAVLGRP